MKTKVLSIVVSALFTVSVLAGCGGSPKVTLPENVSSNLAVLQLPPDTTNLSQDQIDLLDERLQWVKGDLINRLRAKGFNAFLITQENEFTGAGNSHLLKYAITDHKMIPKGARFWGGIMAGTDRLNIHYDLVNAGRQSVLSWDDLQSSTRSWVVIAQKLNQNAVEKVATFLSTQ